jgi:hypothetical protein
VSGSCEHGKQNACRGQAETEQVIADREPEVELDHTYGAPSDRKASGTRRVIGPIAEARLLLHLAAARVN